MHKTYNLRSFILIIVFKFFLLHFLEFQKSTYFDNFWKKVVSYSCYGKSPEIYVLSRQIWNN